LRLLVCVALLRSFQNVTIHTKLRDAHLYLFAHWVLDLLETKPSISSIQSDLLPYLVKLQFTKSAKEWADRSLSKYEQPAIVMSHTREETQYGIEDYAANKRDPIRCYVYVAPETLYCARANTVAAYTQINRDFAAGTVYTYNPWTPLTADNWVKKAQDQYPKAQFGDRCVVGEGLIIEELAASAGPAPKGAVLLSVKRSIIGKGCRFGPDVKIADSIIMDGVVIEAGCTIQNSIIATGSVIKAKSTLKDSRIGAHVVLAPGSDLKNESIASGTDEEEEEN